MRSLRQQNTCAAVCVFTRNSSVLLASHVARSDAESGDLCNSYQTPDKEWVRPSISKRAVGAQESLAAIRQAVKANGPYDGVLGPPAGSS